MTNSVLGIVGGSGVYDIEMDNARWERVDSPWGEPSDEVRRGEIGGLPVVFLPRHGRGHRVSPSHINYRANIDVMKRCRRDRPGIGFGLRLVPRRAPPGTFVIIDQFIDRTFAREKSFFGEGWWRMSPWPTRSRHCWQTPSRQPQRPRTFRMRAVAPTCAWKARNSPPWPKALLYRQWGCDVIGMTNMPEAKLAREAELCYATAAMVTDFDSLAPGPRRGGCHLRSSR
jgi:5'-methylthioadenosine phosphorylase